MKHMTSTVFIVHVRALFSASVFISVVLGQSMNYDYTLQERAVSFTQEPSSQAVLLGSTVMFNCSASVRDLPVLRRDDYNLTTFSWRHNGQTLLASEGSSKWRIMSTTTDSELHINDVLESDSGYYECVCSDGRHNVDGEDRYVAVTVSRRASLEVIVLSTQTVELEEAMNVSLGRHLLLNCNTGASHDPRHVVWKKDRDILTAAEIDEVGVILSNKSLLIFNVTATTAGRYQCIGWYSGEAVNGTTSYDVTVTNPGTAVNTVILDAPSVLGNTVALTCYLIGEEIQTVEWLKDGSQIASDNATTFASTIQITTADSGVYTCKIMGSDIQTSTTIISPPRITGDGRVREDIAKLAMDLVSAPSVKMNCELSVSTSPSTVIYLYKDGENVTDYYDSTTGELKYVVDRHEVDNLFGVYQCFAENSAGVDYTITRVLPRGFSNPPGNFTCIAVDQDNNEDNPKFILNWDRPTLLPGAPPNTVTSYQLSVESSGNHLGTYVNIQTSDYIFDDFDVDGNYKFTVFVMTSTDRGGAKATCVVPDSLIERRERVVRELDVSCPAELDQPIEVKWVNPGVYIPHIGSSKLLEPVVNFISVCLFANRSLDPSEDFLDYADERLFDVETVMLSTVDPVPGAVCLFGGYYKLSDSEYSDRLNFTPVTCSFPAYEPTAAVQLRVSCSDSVAEVEWWSSSLANIDNVSVQSKCITPTWDQHSLNTSLHDGENASITGLPDSSVCTFYGSYQAVSGETKSLDPVQCIVGRNISLIPSTQPPMTTPPSTSGPPRTNSTSPMTTPLSTSGPPRTTSTSPMTNSPHKTTGELVQETTILEQTTDGLQQRNLVVYPVVFTIVGILVVIIIITASMVVVCCVVHYVHGMKERYKQQRHLWYNIKEQDDITQFERNRTDFNCKREKIETAIKVCSASLEQKDPPILPDYPPLYKMCKEIEEDTQSRLTQVDYLYREELGSTHISKASLTSLMKSVNPPRVSESEPMILSRFLDEFDDGSWKSKSDTFQPHNECDKNEFEVPDIQSSIKDSEIDSIHEIELQDKLHSCAVMTEPPAHLQIDHEFIQLVKDTPVAVHPPDYKHSAASSGYGTESETYFSSNTTNYPHTTCPSEYFQSREAELSDMLSVCEEQKENEEVGDLNTKTNLCAQASSDSEVTQDLTSESVKMSSSTQSLPTLSSDRFRALCAGHTHKELDDFKRSNDSSGSTPLYLNYTDEEGYLHLEYRESDI